MKLKNIDFKDGDKSRRITDFEHFFEVYLDRHGNYAFNLNQALYFRFDPAKLQKYQCKHDMFWPLISYNLYKTTRLAWVLMKVNNVDVDSMFKPVLAGQSVSYISKDTIQQILATFQDEEA